MTAHHAEPVRYHPRVDAERLPIEVQWETTTHRAVASNLSMAGLSLTGPLSKKLPLGSQVGVVLPLPSDKPLVTQARVRRRGAGEVALEFVGLDWDDMFALARFLHPRLSA